MAIWDVVKKAINSDFSKPLNELITETSKNIIKQVGKPSVLSDKIVFNVNIPPAGTRTLLDVSGRGALHYALSTQAQWSKNLTTRTLKITVDDRVVFNVQYSHTDSNATGNATLGMLNKNYVFSGDDYIRIPITEGYAGFSYFRFGNTLIVPMSSELFTKSTVQNGLDQNIFLILNGDLEFERRLLIEETCSTAGYQHSTGHGVIINYSLYE